jgi:hypothetical protein
LLAVLAFGGDRASLQAQEKNSRPAILFARTGEALKLLELRCVQCHQAPKLRGGLDVTTRAKLLEGGASGPVAVPGDA